MLNAQKLGLAANTPVETQVQVTDGFVVSGATIPGGNRFYFANGSFDSHTLYTQVGWTDGDDDWKVYWDTDHWVVGTANDASDVASPGGAEPWLATWSAPTLTHPAVQQLAAPSTAQGGVFVSGGTQDGIYSKRGTANGRDYGNLLGTSDDNTSSSYTWDGVDRWRIFDVGGETLYYSLSDVATPDLATNWKNASDDSPAGIAVTSVTQGEVVAGFSFNGVNFQVNGSNDGCNIYADILGVAESIQRAGGAWSAGGAAEGSAFPWQNGSTGVRNDVASEANWEVVP